MNQLQDSLVEGAFADLEVLKGDSQALIALHVKLIETLFIGWVVAGVAWGVEAPHLLAGAYVLKVAIGRSDRSARDVVVCQSGVTHNHYATLWGSFIIPLHGKQSLEQTLILPLGYMD